MWKNMSCIESCYIEADNFIYHIDEYIEPLKYGKLIVIIGITELARDAALKKWP